MNQNGQGVSPHTSSRVERFYAFLLSYPWTVLFCLLAVIATLGLCAKNFQIDASSDTLVNESDQDMQYARVVSSRYDVQGFLVIAYTPKKDLLSEDVLSDIARLKSDLGNLPGVDSVVTLLDVPMLESPPVPVKDLAGELPTIMSPRVDRTLAGKELATSPLYRNLLVSPDLSTTGIQINLTINQHYRTQVARRDALNDKAAAGSLTGAEETELQRLETEILAMRKDFKLDNKKLIADIRSIMERYRTNADLFLGGVDMIANDLIWFIKNDLKIFGLGVFAFLVIVMGYIFRKIRWVAIPLLCCFFSVLAMTGLLGLFGWKVTVISSNFISLQLIITMAISIHLVVRYREEESQNPDHTQRDLVIFTMQEKLVPCLYAALTTIAGFGSLLLCDLKPVITFGWMMLGGVMVSLVFTFLFFPITLSLMKKTPPPPALGGGEALTRWTGNLTEHHGRLIIIVSLIALALSVVGISRLTVENAFVNYFKKSTEIYQGMRVIDQKLGGTTPFDVTLDFSESEDKATVKQEQPAVDDFGEFDDFSEFDEEDTADHYWFTPYKMEKILAVHDYLESIPEIGKVLSLGTILKVAERLTGGRPLDSMELSLIYNELPEEYRQMLIAPYASVADNQARISVRVVDTADSLRRDQLIKKIEKEIPARSSFNQGEARLTGMLVLYNNVLQSLFDSSSGGRPGTNLKRPFFSFNTPQKASLSSSSPNLARMGSPSLKVMVALSLGNLKVRTPVLRFILKACRSSEGGISVRLPDMPDSSSSDRAVLVLASRLESSVAKYIWSEGNFLISRRKLRLFIKMTLVGSTALMVAPAASPLIRLISPMISPLPRKAMLTSLLPRTSTMPERITNRCLLGEPFSITVSPLPNCLCRIKGTRYRTSFFFRVLKKEKVLSSRAIFSLAFSCGSSISKTYSAPFSYRI